VETALTVSYREHVLGRMLEHDELLSEMRPRHVWGASDADKPVLHNEEFVDEDLVVQENKCNGVQRSVHCSVTECATECALQCNGVCNGVQRSAENGKRQVSVRISVNYR
jgi:hypothetical protein